MRLPSETANIAARSFFASACLYCPRCADPMIAPATSEFVEGRGIRHRWLCEACGAETSTTISFSQK